MTDSQDGSSSVPGRSNAQLRSIPSVDKIALSLDHAGLPRPVVIDLIRQQIGEIRENSRQNSAPMDQADLQKTLQDAVFSLAQQRIRPVINGTGVILHTNLGRAPMQPDCMEHIASIGSQYNSLEFDVTTGQRGQRGEYAEILLARICGAEAATIVNNCAAALVLVLKEWTSPDKPEVIISRSELIQIGGGFRIPDILESTGAVLREVGTTNKTTIQDYQRAISSRTAMILKVHQSNFYMTGFVQSPTTEELAQLAGNSQLPILEDLGSGAVIDTATWPGVPAEPTPQAQLKSGLDLVCFSGDKLFGGPQAGILAGRAHHIAALKKNQFFRCLRSDKLILAGIEHVAEQYLNQTHNNQNHLSSNVDRLASISVEALQKRASMIAHHFTTGPGEVACIDCLSTLGGGTLPKAGIPSAGITWRVPGWTAEKLQHAFLRHPSIPVIGRIERDNFITDLRTVFPSQDGMLVSAFQSIVIGQK